MNTSSDLNLMLKTKKNDLWLIQDQQITVIDFLSYLSVVNIQDFQGYVQDLAITRSGLFIGGSEGVYKSNGNFRELIKGNGKKVNPYNNGIVALVDHTLIYLDDSDQKILFPGEVLDFALDPFSQKVLVITDENVWILNIIKQQEKIDVTPDN